MGYLIEEYRGDYDDNIAYYHLADSKVVKTTSIKDGEYKDGSLFEVTKLEDNEVERTRSRKRRDE